MEGRLAPGTPLREQEISNRLGISRTPVREALNRLMMDGLLQSIPNAGVFVKALTLRDIEDVYALRAVLEGLAISLACERGFSDEQLVPVRSAQARYLACLADNDILGVEQADLDFHRSLIALASSQVITDAFTKNHVHILSWRRARQKMGFPSPQEMIVREHQAILDALEKRDGTAASAACQRHIIDGAARILEQQPSKNDGIAMSPQIEMIGNLASERTPR